MNRRIITLIALVALASCATGPSLQSRMAAYIGASAETLVQNMGVPDKQISLNGVQYMAYVHQQVTVMPSPVLIPYGGYGGPFFGPYGGFYGAPFPPSVTVWRCEITFLLHADKVVSFTLRGNACN